MTDAELLRAIEDAMWAQDLDRLDELAPCRCCCHEHTWDDCPARLWHGCRGQGVMTHAEERAWLRHYQERHGMTAEDFYR